MDVGHVWVQGEASLDWVSGEAVAARNWLCGRPVEETLVYQDRSSSEQTLRAHFCRACAIVTIDLELPWDRCPECQRLISPVRRACECGWFAKPIAERLPQDYTNCEQALAAASNLDQRGEWDAAIALYQHIAQQWPQQREYVSACLKAIKEKQALG